MSLDRLRKVWNDISKSSRETSPVRANIVGGSRVVPSNRDSPASVAGGGETSPSPVRPDRLFGDTSQVRMHVLVAAAVERAPLTIERVALEENERASASEEAQTEDPPNINEIMGEEGGRWL